MQNEFSIYCPHCHKYTALSVARAAYETTYRKKAFTDAVWRDEHHREWWIGVCNGCGKPCLVLNNGEVIYPTPSSKPTDPNVPKDLAQDLDEAKRCFSVNCYRACAVMARRCVQNACIEKGATAKNLVEQISDLAQKGVITTDIKDWGTVVRWIGNDAAHPGNNAVEKEDAKDCLDLAE